ncbi:ribosome maturation factor RimM [Desulfonatronovibrio magnus]|uniref:ribosome maturation factor RimM n=1 Tax=Desulfonatronovibrio magnus TaxID=698827 RepID=UPI0005EAF92D|nr:ribosome maturation factor RimM [Desulfonatronovibrio magnus]
MALKDLIVCGKVVKPHGLKGEIQTLWFGNSPLLLDKVPGIYLRKTGARPVQFKVSSWRRHQSRILLILDRLSGRDVAESWRGADILIDPIHLPEPDNEELYVYQLTGCSVWLPEEKYIGVLEEVMDNKGSEVWRITTADHLEVLFPAHDQFIVSIDTHKRKIIIKPPEGLLEIYGIDF